MIADSSNERRGAPSCLPYVYSPPFLSFSLIDEVSSDSHVNHLNSRLSEAPTTHIKLPIIYGPGYCCVNK